MTTARSLPVPRLNAAMRKAFLAHLSETANVSASARKIDMGTSSIYAERRRSAEFRDGWAIALSEGYARLEAEMLHDALTTASGKTSEATLKARTQKDRLRLALLSMHRASAKAALHAAPAPAAPNAENPKASLIAKLFKMRSAAQQRQVMPSAIPERDDG